MLQTVYPVNKDGFLDEEFIFKLAYGELKLPLNSLDNISIQEFVWLLESHFKSKEEFYEYISFAFRIGYVNAKTGKNYEMFPKNTNLSELPSNKISHEDREKELKEIDKLMG